MDAAQARQTIARFPKADPVRAFKTGIDLLRADYPELLLPAARKLAARFPQDARAAQLVGLAARAAGDGPLAYRAFRSAAALAPHDPLIAHSHARTAHEAGKPAVDLFNVATRLAPNDGSALLGLAAALFHDGRPDDAIASLESILAANPLWVDGHSDLAHLRGQMGFDPLVTVAKSLRENPASSELHHLHISLALKARDLDRAEAAVTDARKVLGNVSWLENLVGHIHSERGELAVADAHFGAAGAREDISEVSLYARHLIRAGRADHAAALIQPLVAQDREHLLWPYLSLAWRMLDDPRSQWLDGDQTLVGTYDISKAIGDMDTLAEELRSLHIAKEAPLDQSVRGGTQTDGNLLLRDSPAIQRLRTALLGAVDKHIRQLSKPDAGHPTLIDRRKPRRIAGSWSVRLADAGFHTDHVHSEGWLSSAFYIALPQQDDAGREREEGWLTLGTSRELVPPLAPLQSIEPKIGRLVLFPSTMWHGTRPFPSGERMTVAFDIARPRQSDIR